MIELAGLLFGGVFRLVPAVLEFFTIKEKNKHELSMLQAKITGELDIAEQKGLVEASVAETKKDYIPTDIRWVDTILALVSALSASVRPVLAYWYCVFFYGAMKVAMFLSLRGLGWEDKILQLYTPQDGAVMLSIVSFYFIDRTLRKR